MKSLHALRRLGILAVTLLTTSAVFAQAPAPKPEKGGERKKDPSLAPVEDEAGLPRVLLIGDSISMGYTLPTRELLKGVANVHRIPTNGSSSDVGLKNLDAWLATDGADKKWDVIHFNWGLHDLKHWKDGKLDPAGPQVNPVDQYEKNIREIVARLKKTGAKLIFATTTPVPEGTVGRVAKDENAYNEAALRVMKAEGVAIDDLHALVEAKAADKIQLPANVHFSGPGYKVLAEQVAASIKKALGK
jgi:acyl-CoA thioesterase-1